MNKYAILDIEASGGKKGKEKIIDIYIYQFDGHSVTDQFGSMVNPMKPIDRYVQKLTGITDKRVKRAPQFHELAKRIVDITEGCIIVGHGVHFDYRMLRQEFAALGYKFERRTLDTLALSHQLIPEAESFSLGKLCKSLGIPLHKEHTAEGDTRATLELFKMLLEKDQNKKIVQSFAHIDPTNTNQVKKLLDLEEDLPSKTGVYYIHNSDGKIIFIGHGLNIKKEVNTLFTKKSESCRRLQSQANKISFELTGNELIAQLKLIEEIKRLKPKFEPGISNNFLRWGIYIGSDKEPEVLLAHECRKKALILTSSKSKAHKILDDYLSLNKDYSNFAKHVNSFRNRANKVAIIARGRVKKEKSFVLYTNKVMGYGFYEFYNQIEKKDILSNIMIPLTSNRASDAIIATYILLKKNIKIIELNDE